MSSALQDALSEVEAAPGGSEEIGPQVPGEEPDARPEGPLPDEQNEESDSLSLSSWARRIPEGSHRDFDAHDLWDPEGGGENRLAFHLADAADADTIGYPNGLGVLVGFVELYWTKVLGRGSSGQPDEQDEHDPDGQETMSRDEAERYV